MILRFVLIFLQLLFVLFMLLVSRKLIPIYQRYIESNIANTGSNLFWLNELGNIYLIMTIVYAFDAVFQNYITSIAYLLMMIVPIVRIVLAVLNYEPVEVEEELYKKINIKWNLSVGGMLAMKQRE